MAHGYIAGPVEITNRAMATTAIAFTAKGVVYTPPDHRRLLGFSEGKLALLKQVHTAVTACLAELRPKDPKSNMIRSRLSEVSLALHMLTNDLMFNRLDAPENTVAEFQHWVSKTCTLMENFSRWYNKFPPPPHLTEFQPFRPTTPNRKETPVDKKANAKQVELILDSVKDNEIKAKILMNLVERDRLFARLEKLEDAYAAHPQHSGGLIKVMLEETLPLIYADKHTEAHLKITEIQRRYKILAPLPQEI